MDERDAIQKTGSMGIWGLESGPPLPPIFGNAGGGTGGEMDLKLGNTEDPLCMPQELIPASNRHRPQVRVGVSLDDVFSGVFFSPEGELLEIPSDDEGADLDLNLSSATISETPVEGTSASPIGSSVQAGTQSGQLQVTQPAVLDGRSSDVKMEVEGQESRVVASAAPGSTSVAASGGGVIGASIVPAVAATDLAEAMTDVATTTMGGTIAGSVVAGVQQPQGVVAERAAVSVAPLSAPSAALDAEAEAARAAAEAAAAAAEARAAQETAVSKAAAAVKAAAAHAQAQARIQLGGLGLQAGAQPSTTSTTATAIGASGSGLTAGAGSGLAGRLPRHAMQVDSSASPRPGVGGAGWRLGAGMAGFGSLGAFGAGRAIGGAAVGGGHQPSRRQRHKVSSKDLTEEQRIERRERNREHAKRSRVRKKFLLDSLQRSVDALQTENECLKGSIVEHLGDRGRALVVKCVPEEVTGIVTSNPDQATKILDDPDYSLVKALQTAQQNFVITDASLPDNPIVFASRGFLELTGYKLSDVLGRNCRFLQGPETDPRAVDKIRKAIEKGDDASVCLLNYRADMTTFWNLFFVAALRDGDGTTVNYVGVQCKVGDDYARIVVAEQNRQLTAPAPPIRRGSSVAMRARQSPHSSMAAAAAVAAVAATPATTVAGAGAGAAPALTSSAPGSVGGAAPPGNAKTMQFQ